MPRSTSSRVFTLVIEPPEQTDFFTTSQQHVVERLAAGHRIERYGREWIVGKTEQVDGLLTGRIGFRGGDGIAEVWDEELQDFRDVAVPAGLTAPFGVRLSDLRLALQPRANLKLNGLIGALEALLSEATGRWVIRGARTPTTFDTWLASVEKITAVRITVRKPNPHYQDTPDLEALLEQEAAEVATLELRNADVGLTLDSPFVQQTQSHIARGYGEASYTGLRTDGTETRETVYSTRYGSEEESTDADVNPDTGEVEPSVIREVLAQEPVEGQTEQDG